MADRKPVIGLITSTEIKDSDEVVVNPKIKGLVEEFGGEVRAFNYKKLELGELKSEAECIDAMIFPGGGDVDPSYFGAERIPECDKPNEKRDSIELNLFPMLMERNLPILGICRGCQVMNVFFGGTLIQDMPTQRGIEHRQNDANGRYFHDVIIKEGNRLYNAVGTTKLLTNSYHHQAVDVLAQGFKLTASAEDGTVEAFESEDSSRFLMGIQWHPESVPEDPASKAIFKAFLDFVKMQLECGCSNR